jgi:hypothetical protein
MNFKKQKYLTFKIYLLVNNTIIWLKFFLFQQDFEYLKKKKNQKFRLYRI